MDCHLRVERSDTAFAARIIRPGQIFRAPLAHGDGNYFAERRHVGRGWKARVSWPFATSTPAGATIVPAANAQWLCPRSIAGIYSPRICACSA